MTITEDLKDKLLSNTRGGYLGLSWDVVDKHGKPVHPPIPAQGNYIVAENYYGYTILYVGENNELVECEVVP